MARFSLVSQSTRITQEKVLLLRLTARTPEPRPFHLLLLRASMARPGCSLINSVRKATLIRNFSFRGSAQAVYSTGSSQTSRRVLRGSVILYNWYCLLSDTRDGKDAVSGMTETTATDQVTRLHEPCGSRCHWQSHGSNVCKRASCTCGSNLGGRRTCGWSGQKPEVREGQAQTFNWGNVVMSNSITTSIGQDMGKSARSNE